HLIRAASAATRQHDASPPTGRSWQGFGGWFHSFRYPLAAPYERNGSARLDQSPPLAKHLGWHLRVGIDAAAHGSIGELGRRGARRLLLAEEPRALGRCHGKYCLLALRRARQLRGHERRVIRRD